MPAAAADVVLRARSRSNTSNGPKSGLQVNLAESPGCDDGQRNPPESLCGNHGVFGSETGANTVRDRSFAQNRERKHEVDEI